MSKYKNKNGFTLIELLVVMAIISLLATLAVTTLNNAREKSRDAKRIADIRQIITALDLYYDQNNAYPSNSDNDCSGWDVGYNGSASDPFIQPLVTAGFMGQVPGDPTDTSSCGGYRYYRYGAGSYGCDASKGAYYVLGITDLETDSRPPTKFEGSGWSCPSRNWQNEMDWVTGRFELE